jgi:PAS domain S-box-containing protein
MITPSSTDRQWTERSSAVPPPLTNNQSMFQLLFERSADAIWLLDPQEVVFVDCNQAAVDLMRARDKEQLLKKRPGDLSPPTQPDGQDSAEKAAQVTALTEQKGTQIFEWIARRLDGTDVPLEVMSTPITSEGRRLNVIISRDTTERKKAEEALRASERKFRELFEASCDAIMILDPETRRFLDCNAAALRRGTSATKEWLLSQSVDDLSPERQPDGRLSKEAACESIQRALREGPQRFEWLGKNYDGTDLPLEILLSPIRIGDRILLVDVARDITERKKTEQKILELNQDLERRILERTAELTQANDQLKAEMAERLRRDKIQSALFQISEAVHAADDLQSLYRRIHSIVKTLMPSENFYIALLDPVAGTISFSYYTDQFARQAPAPRPQAEGLTGTVLGFGRPWLTDCREYSEARRAADLAAAGDAATAAEIASRPYPVIWLGVPLVAQGQAFGVMAVRDYFNEAAYGENEKQILAFVGEQTAQAINRKRAEQALRESEEKFRALYEASSQGVILHDEHQMLEVNPACLRILGFSDAAEMIGKHPADTSAPIQPNGERADVLARKYIEECMTRGTARFDWLARNSSGREVPIEIVLTRIQWGGRQLIQAVFNDISERKRTEAELLRTLAREKELNQLKSNFVSMVSHEFRTPLGIIQSSAEILSDYLEQLQPAERQEQLRSIVKNTQRMAAMMEEVLVLSRLDAGKMDFKPGPLDLAAFCHRVADEVLSATDRSCPIELFLSPIAQEAQADERLLSHIFTNLLNNAVKYSEAGQTIQFVVQRHGAEAICVVRDSGIGISAEDQRWLFHAFQRGRNVGDRPGTGLGLVLVKRCADLHRGKIQIKSTLGAGTTVTVRLPVFGADA